MKKISFKIFLILYILINIFPLNSIEKITIDLDKATSLILANNKELKISKAVLKIKDKAFYYELRKFLPNLSLGYSNSNSVAFDAPDSRNSKLNLGLNILTFDGGKIIFNYIFQKTELEFNKKEILIQINKVLTEAKNTYYSLLLFEEKEKLQKALFDIGLIQERNAELELATGVISQVDYYDIKLKVKQIQIDLEKAKREKNNAYIDFKYAIGLENYNIELDQSIKYDFLDLTSDDTAFFQNIATSNRLDLSKSFQGVLKSKIQHWYNILSFLPEVTTGVNFALTDEEFPPRNKSWSVNFTVKIPLAYLPLNVSPGLGSEGSDNATRSTSNSASSDIAQNLTYENDIANSQISLASESIKYKELIKEIKKQVRLQIEDYIEQLKIYKLKLLQNEFNGKKVRIMQLKLTLGEVKRVDLLKEEMEYNKSLIEEKNMLFNIINSEANLKNTIGALNIDINQLLINKREISGIKNEKTK